MNVKRADSDTIALVGLDAIFCELLHQIVPSADPRGSQRAQDRLYPSPSDGRDADMDDEWRAYVEPGLRELFRSHLDVVEEDLQRLPVKVTSEPKTLTIPVEHLDDWLNALNQARLTLACRHDVADRDMESLPALDDERGMAIFQIHFYGFLQECFLREMA